MRDPGTRWWWYPGERSNGRPLLFLPPAGADQTIAVPLVPLLAAQRLAVLRMPGRGIRRDEPAPTDGAQVLAELAGQVAALAGPAPLVVGHSFGGALAAALVARLEADGVPVARLVVVASTPPTVAREAVGGARDLDSYVAARVARLLADGAVPPGIADHPELGPRVRTDLETDVRISCGLPEPVVLTTPVTSVVARDDALVARAGAARWRELTSGDFEEVVVGGGHFFYRDSPAVLARLLRGELDALDGAYTHR